MIDFEWTIKFGDVLTVVGAAFVGGSILYKRGGNEVRSGLTLKSLTDEVKDMKDKLELLAKVITQLAVQDTKITNLAQQFTMLQRNVEDLRRGNGFVHGRTGVDGEYP